MRDLYVPLPIVWCWCAFLGVGTPQHGRSAFCWEGVWAGPPALRPFRPPCGAALSANCFHGPPGCEVHPDYWAWAR